MKSRVVLWLIAAAFAVWMLFALWLAAPSGSEPPTTSSADSAPTAPPATTTVKVKVDRRLDGLTAAGWRKAAVRYRRRVGSLGRALRFDPETATAIGVACVVYGHCAELWRKAGCESTFRRYAYNPASGAAGLFQFVGSTWRSTPFGRLSVYDPYVDALAAGWMHAHGRGGEWSCR